MSELDAPVVQRMPSPGDPSTASMSKVARLWEWFWRDTALREARNVMPPDPKEALELMRRARLAAEVARRTLEPSAPFLDGSAAALACDLYRQAVYWRLAAAQAGGAPGAESSALRALWEQADHALLLGAAGSAENLALVQNALVEGDFIQFSKLSSEEQSRVAGRVSAFAEALLGSGEQKLARVEQLLFQRTLRVVGVIIAIFAVYLGAGLAASLLEDSREVSGGKKWRASSSHTSACKSPQQRCRSDFFFHTKEENEPWVRLDLGETTTVSAVSIENRQDCCGERALPLVVEVSTDGKSFREVARRSEGFQSWKAEFAPVEARFVRARVERKSILHLNRFRVFR